MSLLEIIKTRRSTRNFQDKPLNDEDIIKILDAGRLAPTGGNLQRWEFIYVSNPKVLKMVKNCSPGFYGNAMGAIVIGYEESGKEFGRTSYNKVVGVLDVGHSSENIQLAAHALGLGTCAIASFNEEAIKKVLNTPKDWKPILVISIGYPEKNPSMPTKKRLSDIAYHNEYGVRWTKLEERR
jgi:nitroreductase